MKKILLIAGCWILVAGSFGQTVSQKIQKAYQQFTNDPQLKHAISSLYVIDTKTGKVVFDKNSQIGLAGASTQKIITATTAFELLGKDYRYKTDFGYDGKIEKEVLNGNLYVIGSGDPTFGSWRYDGTKMDISDDLFTEALHQEKINLLRGSLIGIAKNFESQKIPGGWIWEDIGNYYGAGAGALNWNENQFDLILKPGRQIKDSVKIIRTSPELTNDFLNELKTGPKGSGDNGYIYFSPGFSSYTVRGTIPCCVDTFVISGATSESDYFTLNHFAGILIKKKFKEDPRSFHIGVNPINMTNPKIIYTHYSPSLDSIIYWFLKKSINLYGEALIKTFAYEKKGFGSTDSGVVIVKDFWKQKGLDENEINICDGSGLSPLNRITTHAQVEVLKYAKTKDWFPYFYDALPEYNNMKMKSGTINGVKGFCGYHISKKGNEYIFSFLVNNYNGSPSALVDKMYKVLNTLK